MFADGTKDKCLQIFTNVYEYLQLFFKQMFTNADDVNDREDNRGMFTNISQVINNIILMD